jgi:hypothetical protein
VKKIEKFFLEHKKLKLKILGSGLAKPHYSPFSYAFTARLTVE